MIVLLIVGLPMENDDFRRTQINGNSCHRLVVILKPVAELGTTDDTRSAISIRSAVDLALDFCFPKQASERPVLLKTEQIDQNQQ